MKNKNALKLIVLLLLTLFLGCSKDDDSSTIDNPVNNNNNTATVALPEIYQKFYNLLDIYIEGDYVVIKTSNSPDHGSPFYHENNSLYEAYNGTNSNFSTEINWMGGTLDPDLVEQESTFRIPLNPTEDSNHQATTTGAIGVALNGVAIYNQYNGGGQLLDDTEFDNIDQYNGHPTPTNLEYHYHLEPLWITANNGSDSVIGVLRDGFFVYGPMENGVEIITADLDDYHGHFGVTEDYPNGIYHYHTTADAPWINGDGYYGAPGTLTD